MANTQGIKAGRAYVELGVGDKLTAGLKRAQTRLKAFGDHVTALGQKIMAGGLAAAAPMGLAARIFGGFEDQMLTVRAVTGATEKQFADLTDQAKMLGRTTSFTAKQVAEGMTSLGRAGFKTDEIQAAIPAVLNLARATGTDLGRAADFAANAVRSFGMSAADTTRVADVLTATANNSAQTLEDLAEALKYVAPVAADAGESVESTSKALGVLANMGIKGSMAGTAVRKLMLSFADPAVRKTLAGIGVAATDATGNLRPLGDVMADLGQAMAKMPNADRLALAMNMFGQRAISGALKLSGSADQIAALGKAIDAAGGTAERTAKMMDSGLGGAFRIMMSAAEGAALAVGEALSGTLKQAMGLVQRAAEAVAGWVERNRELVTVIGLVTAGTIAAGAALIAAGVAIKGLGVLLSVAGAPLALFGKGIKLVGVLLSALVSPVGLTIAAVAGLGVAIVYYTGAGGKALDWLRGVFGNLAADASEAWQGMAGALASGDIGLAAKVLWTTLKMWWTKGVASISGVWNDAMLWLKDTFTSAWGGLRSIFSTVSYGLKVAWTETTSFLADLWVGFANGVLKAWHWVGMELTKAWNKVKGVFDDSFDSDAANAQAEAEYNARKTALDKETAARKAAIETARQAEREQEAQDHADSLRRIAEETHASRNKLRQEHDAKIKASEDELKAARAEWKAAVEAGKEKGRPHPAAGAPPPGKPKDPADLARHIAGAAGGLGERVQTSVGTFNAARLQGFGTSDAINRVVSATEKTAKNTQKLVDQGEDEFE